LRFDLSHDNGSAGVLAALQWADGIAELNVAGLRIPPLHRSGAIPIVPPTLATVSTGVVTVDPA
jgi:hypothetical protein